MYKSLRTCTLARALALPLAAALFALPVPGQQPQRTNAAGDTIVKLAGRPLHSGVAALVSEISIGVVDGADEYMFGNIAELAVGADGSIYVFDRQVPALRKYDRAGKFVRSLGRKGSGPGEYLSGGGLDLMPDGRVLLWDAGNWRINVYSAAGESIGSWPTPSGMGAGATMSTSRSLLVDTAGFVYYRRHLRDLRQPGQGRIVWIRLNGSGEVVDTLDAPDFLPEPKGLSATSPAGNAYSSTNVPFSPSPVWLLSPLGYMITGVPDRYAFELLIPPASARGSRLPLWKPGQPIISIRRDVKPEPVSSSERATAKQEIEEQMRRTQPAWTWNGPDIPKNKPFYKNLYAAADGRIWVPIVPETSPSIGRFNTSIGGGGSRGVTGPRPEPPKAADKKPQPALYDVFDPNGAYVGQVEVPPKVSTVVRRGDYMWGIAYDEFDVATVRRYRIAWAK